MQLAENSTSSHQYFPIILDTHANDHECKHQDDNYGYYIGQVMEQKHYYLSAPFSGSLLELA